MTAWQTLCKDGLPTRYAVASVAFLNFIYVYMLRLNVNIVLVAMINYTAIPHSEVTPAQECGQDLVVLQHQALNGTEPKEPDGEFEWDETVQSLVSGSFFWGYIVTQAIAGRMAEKLGTKYLVASAQGLVGIVTVCMPLLARAGVEYFIVGRVLLGFAQGVIVPSVQPLVTKWAPRPERNSFTTFIFSGSQVGTILGIVLSGMMADLLGWDSAFYVEGGLAILVILPWLYVVYDSPRRHPRISASELEFIESATEAGHSQADKTLAVPWRAMATSTPCWALLAATLGNNWAFYVLLVELPIYMKTILGLDLKSNALLSALPWLVMWLFSLLLARAADWTTNKRGWLSLNVVRKTANSVAHLGTAVCLVAVAFLGCDRLSTLALLTLSIGLMGAVYSGFLVNHLDLAPVNFAGTLYGIVSGLSSVNSWLAPLVVASLTDGNQSLRQWRIAFLICAGVLTFDAVVFILFGSTERQHWDSVPVRRVEEADRHESLPLQPVESNAR